MFDHYTKDHNLHVIHDKETGKMFQYGTSEKGTKAGRNVEHHFMDEHDNPIEDHDFMRLAPHLHKAWDKHPELLD